MDSGLQGVVAAEIVLSRSDGARGILWVRGHTLDELVTDYGYEGTGALLWEGFLGDGLTRDGMRIALGEGRVAAFMRLSEWLTAAAHRPMVEGVRLACAFLPEDSRPPAILATLSVAIAALIRTSRGQAPLAPEPNIGSAADLLRMIHGNRPPSRWQQRSTTISLPLAKTGSAPRLLRRALSSRPGRRSLQPCSALTAPLLALCTAAPPVRRLTCWIMRRRAAI
jgi:citrate synthase